MAKPKNDRPGRKNKGIKLIIIAAASLIGAIIVITAGAMVYFTSKITSDSVPIVSASHGPVNSSTPIPTPDLPVITGEPEDIGEDYDEPLPAPAGTATPSDAPATTARPIYRQVPIDKNVINILIIGRDARPYQTGNGRSDTMMLLSYNRKESKASIVSLMRDSWVPIEGCGWNRLNAAYSFGGIGLSVNTINALFDLDIQNYIVVNFDAMTQLVDKLGGLDVTIKEVESAYYKNKLGWNIDAGLRHLDGEHALLHARNRRSNGGDFERIRRQQDIMFAVYDKLKNLNDPVLLANLIGFMMDNVKTNIPPDTLFSLAMEVIEKGGVEIQRGRMPDDRTWRYANKEGRSVITIDIKANKDYLHGLIYSDK